MELEQGSREGAAMRTKTDLRARGRLSVEREGGGGESEGSESGEAEE